MPVCHVLSCQEVLRKLPDSRSRLLKEQRAFHENGESHIPDSCLPRFVVHTYKCASSLASCHKLASYLSKKFNLQNWGGDDSKLCLVLPSCSTEVVLVPSAFHVHLEGCFLFNLKSLPRSYCPQLDSHSNSSAVNLLAHSQTLP